MNHQTTVIGEQIGSQNQTLEDIKTFVFGRQSVIESELAETKQRLSDLEEATLKHVNNVNTVVENEMNRFEKVITAVEKHQLSTIEENNKSIDEFRKEVSRAKNDTEDALARKLENMDAHMKLVDNELSKC